MTTKITSANIDTTSVATAASANTANFNIALLGFKMAITEGLTVFNLIDGIVDEFEDEGGTDASASTNLLYNSTDDYYINSTTPDGNAIPGGTPYSAGFSVSSITEPDTSVAGTNPAQGSGAAGTFTVPIGLTTTSVFMWGGGGAGGSYGPFGPNDRTYAGGGGGFTTGTLATSPGQVLKVDVAEGATSGPNALGGKGGKGGGNAPGGDPASGAGGGLSGIFNNSLTIACASYPSSVPQIYAIAAGGGGGGGAFIGPQSGGGGGGLTGDAAGQTTSQQTAVSAGGGGGGQTSGGQAGCKSGVFLEGGNADGNRGAGGAGFFGGGGSDPTTGAPGHGGGGGGSAYYGNPSVTCASTSEGSGTTAGGQPNPNYSPSYANGGPAGVNAGQDGYILITGTSSPVPATTTSSTIISDPFTSNTVPTTTRLVVFEENVGSPTLNTDIIASVSRNGGTNFTTVTLSDSGYVTGSSGQRILTGQASVSGQPSGQSMKWKLELANQTVKIHGVSLQWS
jgi:hypothetical protein